MNVQAFGVWDAPVTDGAEWIEVPTDRRCMYCDLPFAPGDNGRCMYCDLPFAPGDNGRCMYCDLPFAPGDNGAVMPTGLAQHRECSLRSVYGGIGHVVNHERYCVGMGDPDAGMSFRASALLVWRMTVDGVPVLEDHLDMLAGRPRKDRDAHD